jgi:TolA-binding protein
MSKLRAVAFVAFFFVTLFGVSTVFAQKTVVLIHEDVEFKNAIELFQKEKFGAAQKSFNKIISSHNNLNSSIRSDAEYYSAICAIELFNKDGEFYLKQFITNYPESPKVKNAYFYLAKYNYIKKKYTEANEWFDKVDIYDLTTEELAEFYFKRGYSYFMTEKIDLAKKDFYEIKDIDNIYAASAKYYYAHILYNEKNYETALKDFLKLQYNETFKSVVPFYIAQLYYLQGKYDDVITYAPKLLDSVNSKRAPEIARIIGESYYHTSRYADAIPYLKKYETSVGTLLRDDSYEMGYAYYKIKDYDNARNYFINTTSIDNDLLAQNAFYHLADCYLKAGQKQNARNAFGLSANLSFDRVIQEDALFNYAKLSYEQAFNPYNDAIKAFQKYIKEYPNSIRVDEAYTYLVNVFITSKNYKDALDAIENIKMLTPELAQIYQKVAFYRAVELFNNTQYGDALDHFNKAVIHKSDKLLTALSMYWIGECYYREQQYQSAIYSYLAYLDEPGSVSASEITDANYNIGYCYFKQKDYTNSNLWFRRFVTFKPNADPEKVNDAYNRIGDGYFMMRDFSNAVEYYEEAHKMKLVDADYSLYQKALSNGVQKKYKAKVDDLNLFIQNYLKSPYIQKVKLELAQSYLADKQNDLALSSFKNFIEEYPNSFYVNTCLSKIGLIYYNTKDDDNALLYFDRLIKRDRKSSEANEAIHLVKEIYTAKGNIQGLEEYLSSIGASMPVLALDSLTYNVAKTRYLEQDCKVAVVDFEKYIQRFPEGVFIVNASYYKAECEQQNGNIDGALAGYSFVLSKNRNQFTEKSLYYASDILFKKQNYSQAFDYYKQLSTLSEDAKSIVTSAIGLMRCAYYLKNYSDAIAYSNIVLGIEKIEITYINEAHYIIAHSLLATQKLDDAFAEFRALANTAKNELGAEALYQVAFIQHQKGDYKECEKTVFDFINSDGDYPYWVTKALILLADNYVALKDNFQAKTTLKSIVTDSDIPELIKIAQEKIDKITAEEEAAKVIKPQLEPMKIQFEGDTLEQKKLFEEPVIEPVKENN